jgi:hypothetical protein
MHIGYHTPPLSWFQDHMQYRVLQQRQEMDNVPGLRWRFGIRLYGPCTAVPSLLYLPHLPRAATGLKKKKQWACASKSMNCSKKTRGAKRTVYPSSEDLLDTRNDGYSSYVRFLANLVEHLCVLLPEPWWRRHAQSPVFMILVRTNSLVIVCC